MKLVTILAGAAILVAPVAAFAANADHPYQNVDHSNDAGNGTGDSQVDRLNQAQLDSNGTPNGGYAYARPPVAYYAPYAAQPGDAPPVYAPPAYAPPTYAPRAY